MSDVVIQVDHLAKRYRLGQGSERYATIRTALSDTLGRPLRRGERTAREPEHVWALRDVSFEIRAGELVGIIGRNGVGKTTLLKILSRITEPTKGWAEVEGRVGSLLEVGTGIHPELTGRENIYLAGAVLGMRRAEIKRRYDEIVAFAEVEDFLDTPMKRYSSGMYVRLAFAVAAHLSPDILLVDEVLAVGDAAFQRKCIGKMSDVADEGRTVLFVSHNMAIVQSLCRRGIFIDDGLVAYEGGIVDAIATYLRTLEDASTIELGSRTDRRGRGRIRLERLRVDGDGSGIVGAGRPISFRFELSDVTPGTACFFTIYNHLGQPVAHFTSAIAGEGDEHGAGGLTFVCELDELPLVPGRYWVTVGVQADGEVQDHIEAASVFHVEQGVVSGRPVARDPGYGSVALRHRWTTP